MENNLLDTAKSFFNEDTVSQIASKVGISTDQAKTGLNSVLPSLFLGLEESKGDGLASVLSFFKSKFSNFDFSDISKFSSADHDGDQPGSNPLGSLFGGKFSQITSTIAQFLGFDASQISGLFKSAIPAVVGALTQKGTNWDIGQIGDLLSSNKSNFLSALPAGLGLSSLFGQSNPVHIPTPEAIPAVEPVIDPVKDVFSEDPIIKAETRMERERVTPAAAYNEEKKKSGLWWLLVPLILLALWFFFGKACSGEKKDAAMTDSTNVEVSTIIEDTSNNTGLEVVRENLIVTLPNNVSVNAFKGGIEDQLVQFLLTDYKSLSEEDLKNKWFDFDNLNFETGTAKILPESQAQLNNLVEILKAFPDAKVKIGGYTDKTGNEDFNMKLSADRANAVKVELEKLGVGDRVVETEGYGSQHAKFSAEAPESDRVKDRRVSISVRI